MLEKRMQKQRALKWRELFSHLIRVHRRALQKATSAAEAERQREAKEPELGEEWANAAKAEMDKRAAEARKAKAEKGGPPPPPPPPPSPPSFKTARVAVTTKWRRQ